MKMRGGWKKSSVYASLFSSELDALICVRWCGGAGLFSESHWFVAAHARMWLCIGTPRNKDPDNSMFVLQNMGVEKM